MNQKLFKMITEKMPVFSKSQKLIGSFVIEHYEKAAFMTASKLGNTVGVSESTVVRFATELGFDGYPQLQKSLQDLIKHRLTSIQRIQVTSEQIGSEESILSKVLNSDSEKIKKTLEAINTKTFHNAVESIVNAKTIYIIGIRTSGTLASFLNLYLNHIFENVKLISSSSRSEMFEQMHRINENDVFIAISFPRYSKKTVIAADFAKASGACVIAITDTDTSPLALLADDLLLAKSDMTSFVDSLVAPLSLINALIVAVGLKKCDEISDTYEKLENIWEKYNVYEKTEEYI